MVLENALMWKNAHNCSILCVASMPCGDAEVKGSAINEKKTYNVASGSSHFAATMLCGNGWLYNPAIRSSSNKTRLPRSVLWMMIIAVFICHKTIGHILLLLQVSLKCFECRFEQIAWCQNFVVVSGLAGWNDMYEGQLPDSTRNNHRVLTFFLFILLHSLASVLLCLLSPTSFILFLTGLTSMMSFFPEQIINAKNQRTSTQISAIFTEQRELWLGCKWIEVS